MKERATAVFSDIHSNLDALEAVLADMDSLGVKRYVCLGDIVGYGPSPVASLKRVRALNCPIVRGNHDEAVASDVPVGDFRDVAQAGIEFSRTKLSVEARAFLGALPLTIEYEGCQFVHASLHEPSNWNYIMREFDAEMHFKHQTAHVCFCGHTHIPVVWQKKGDQLPAGRNGVGTVKLDRDCISLVNVGAVGQPRDFNPDACYVIYDPEEQTVEFRRVKYDTTKARRKISRAKLPKFLGQRLALGR